MSAVLQTQELFCGLEGEAGEHREPLLPSSSTPRLGLSAAPTSGRTVRPGALQVFGRKQAAVRQEKGRSAAVAVLSSGTFRGSAGSAPVCPAHGCGAATGILAAMSSSAHASTSIYLNWLIIAELFRSLSQKAFGSWVGKISEKTTNLNCKALINSSALSTKAPWRNH